MYALVFVAALLASATLTPLVRDYSIAHKWVSIPSSDRHVHTRPIPRLGGVAIFLTLWGMALLARWLTGHFATRAFPFSYLTLKIMGPATVIFLLGLIDDFYGLSPYIKFAVQAVFQRTRNFSVVDPCRSSPFGVARRTSADNSLGSVDYQCFQFD